MVIFLGLLLALCYVMGAALWFDTHPFDPGGWPTKWGFFWRGFAHGMVGVHWPLMLCLAWWIRALEKALMSIR